MNKPELSAAFRMAEKGDYDLNDANLFMGFALPDFKPVYVTLRQVAAIIAYQCFFVFGSGYDTGAFQELARCGRVRFNVID